MNQEGVTWLVHYLDDFLMLGLRDSLECAGNMEVMAAGCREVGLPIEASKIVGPATVISFLDMELDQENKAS